MYDYRETLRRHVAAKIPITAQYMTCPEVLQDSKLFCQYATALAGTLVISLDSYVVGMPEERIVIREKWPKDWWQAFRERWFPAFWLRKRPVQYNEIDIDKTVFKRVCPHVRVRDQDTHLQWLAKG